MDAFSTGTVKVNTSPLGRDRVYTLSLWPYSGVLIALRMVVGVDIKACILWTRRI
jgi:hypothetical protein